MSKRLCISLLLAAALGAASASAETAGGGRQELPARIDDAIAFALSNRVEPALAAKEREAAALRLGVARGNFLPSVLLTGNSRYIKVVDKFTGTEIRGNLGGEELRVRVENAQPAFEWRAGVDVNYNLYSGGQDSASVAESLAEQRAQRFAESDARAKVSQEVTKAYWSLRKAQIQTGISERALQLAQKRLLVAETSVASGLNPGSDTDLETLAVKEADIALAEAKSQEALELNGYRHSLGLYDSVFSAPVPRVPLLDDPQAVGAADLVPAAERPEAKRLQAEVAAAEARVRQAEGAYRPTVDLFTTYKMVGRDENDYLESLSRIRSDYYNVGVSVSFTLFDGYRDRIALAKRQEEMARLRLRQTREQLESENQEKVGEKKRLKREADLALERLKLYEARQKVMAEKHRSGKASEVEFLEAAKNYQDFADKLLLSRIDLALAEQSLAIVNRRD